MTKKKQRLVVVSSHEPPVPLVRLAEFPGSPESLAARGD